MINKLIDICSNIITVIENIYKEDKIEKVDIHRYYNTYHGHPVDQIENVHKTLRKNCDSIIFFAGDSSLDNKYWLLTDNTATYGEEACNHYEKVL